MAQIIPPTVKQVFSEVSTYLTGLNANDRQLLKEASRVERSIDSLIHMIAHIAEQGSDEDCLASYNAYARGTIVSMVTDVNKCLHATWKAFGKGPTRRLAIKRGAAQFDRVWHECPHSASRVVIAGRLARTEFSAEFMEGAQAMARALDIELQDCRGEQRTHAGADNALATMAQKKRLDPECDSILVVFDDADKLSADIATLKRVGFRVITTGYKNGLIRQDDVRTGEVLGQQCVDDELAVRSAEGQHRSVALVIKFGFNVDSNPPEQRRQGICSQLRRSGLFEEPVTIEVATTDAPPYDCAAEKAVEEIRKAMKHFGPDKVTAVFPRTEVVTQRILRLVSSEYPGTRVYGERLITSDLHQLSHVGSPMAAICGVLPYSYGQYAVRAAASKRMGDPWPAIPPLVITKQMAVTLGLIASDRVMSELATLDPELHQGQYAWQEWMKPICGATYGPSLHALKKLPAP